MVTANMRPSQVSIVRLHEPPRAIDHHASPTVLLAHEIRHLAQASLTWLMSIASRFVTVSQGLSTVEPYALCHDEEAAADYQGMAAIDENWASGAWAPVRKLDGSIVPP